MLAMMNDVFMIPIVAMLIPIIVVPVAIAAKQARRRREFEHAEKRGPGAGPADPQSHAWPALVAIFIGAGVPVGTFLICWLATASTNHVTDQIFMVAGLVSFAAVIAGFRLGANLIAASSVLHEETPVVRNGKPTLDPDAYDVVSRRG